MPPGFFAHLLLFVVMTSLCLVGRPLEVPAWPCGTVLEYHFLQLLWSQGPSRRCGLQGVCWCLAESSCDLLEGIKAGAMERQCLVGEGGLAGIQPVTPVLSHVYEAGDFLSPN